LITDTSDAPDDQGWLTGAGGGGTGEPSLIVWSI